jgi:hypothetical protein
LRFVDLHFNISRVVEIRIAKMDAVAKPLLADMSLAALLATLDTHDSKSLVFDYGDGRQVQPGYHITEVKAGSFVTLDCGGNPDAWQETILQVEDIPAPEGKTFMAVGKFRAILGQVDRKIRLAGDARLTLEVSRPDEAMRVYDVAAVDIEADRAIVELGERPAICKPRHRAAQAVSGACCAPATSASTGASCCA